MKRYTSVFELAAQGFERDKDITIEGDAKEGSLHCDDGSMYSYPDHKAYYIHLKN